MVERTDVLDDVYSYTGSLASLSGTLIVSVFSGPGSGTIEFDDTDDDKAFDAGEIGTWNGDAATYEGGGTATVGVSLLGIDVPLGSSVPVHVFSTATECHFYYPEEDQSALLDSLASDILANPALNTVLSILGLDTLEEVVVYLEANAVLTFDLDANDPLPVCFTDGCFLETPFGDAPIDEVRVGDHIIDINGNRHEVIWHGRAHVNLNAMTPKVRASYLPVVIPAHAFGEGRPKEEVRLSQQHRVMVGGAECELYFGIGTALAPARSLLGRKIKLDWTAMSLTYHHILCEDHSVVRANGLETETMLPEKMAKSALGKAGWDEILRLFPELETKTCCRAAVPALPLLKRFEGSLFAQ